MTTLNESGEVAVEVACSVAPVTWTEVADLLGLSRSQVYRVKDSIGLNDCDPEEAYPIMLECREYTKKRVGGDRKHTIQGYLRSKGYGRV